MPVQPPPNRPLRPRARLLRTLGEELISNEGVAIIELVKNAYDADATRVMIRFSGPLEPDHGSIEVIDNGHGMDLQTVQTVWMEPATSSKRTQQRSEKFKRRHLGEKGIGRFASSRLAKELEVITRREGSPKEIHALFDWRQFEDESKYLDEIEILWDVRDPVDIKLGGSIEVLWRNEQKRPPATSLASGTILRMAHLKQKWGDKQFEDLRRDLARLVSPRVTKAEDFEIELDLPDEFSRLSSKVEAPPILKYPHYRVKGTVDPAGSYDITYEILADGIEKRVKGRLLRLKDEMGRYPLHDIEHGTSDNRQPEFFKTIESGPVDIDLKVWDRDDLGNVVQKRFYSTITDVRRDLDAVAGVNIYRDGFRVLPYGEPKDDWMRLDIRRVLKPTVRLSNNQIYGIINISADSNPSLRDQSNREGLDENQALQDLRDMMIAILTRLEALRYASRPRDSKKGGAPVGGLFAGLDLKPVSDYLAKHLPQDKAAKEIVEKTEMAIGGQLKEIQTVMGRYQRLATLGQLIDHVLHDGRTPISSINSQADQGISETSQPQPPTPNVLNRLHGRFTAIRTQGDVLYTAFRRMEPFGGRKRGRPSQFYLEEIIRDAFAVFTNEMERLGVKTTLPRTQTLVRVDPAEMQEVIINLLQNSLYWLEQVRETTREIRVAVDRKDQNHVDITFSDSGPGVPPEIRDLIFEPYFSTKPEGIGLGLAIAGEIVTDYYAGSLQLLESGPLPGANFLITLRKRV